MKKEELFEALGEINSRTVQRNTLERYRERIRTYYFRLAAVAAAIIAVGTGLYVFRIADLTHGIKEEAAAESAGMIATESAQMDTEEAVAAEEAPAAEASEEFSDNGYDYKEMAVNDEAADERPAAEAVAEADDMAPVKSSAAQRNEVFGVNVKLPENENWIQEELRTENESEIRVVYNDLIAGAECVLYGVNTEMMELPEIEFDVAFDDSLDETWEGKDPDGKTRYLKVKHSEDKKVILATWDYEGYEFEITGEFKGDSRDASPIAKTAIYVMNNLK